MCANCGSDCRCCGFCEDLPVGANCPYCGLRPAIATVTANAAGGLGLLVTFAGVYVLAWLAF